MYILITYYVYHIKHQNTIQNFDSHAHDYTKSASVNQRPSKLFSAARLLPQKLTILEEN
jgi:hypothetical protein